MAEDCVDHATMLAKLDDRPCITKTLPIHGCLESDRALDALSIYGSDAAKIRTLSSQDTKLAEQLHPSLPYIGAEVVWSVREEMARTVEDFLARRVRALFLNSQAASEMAPMVAEIMAGEMKKDGNWQKEQVAAFQTLCKQ